MAEKLSITLPSDMVDALKSRVRDGFYTSTSDALRQAVVLLLKHEDEQPDNLAEIRARIQRSINDPRPALNGKQMRQHLDTLYAKHGTTK
ncbi:ribbon-helix-helix domain-containing protein [Phyllobacterium sp. YR531]|uniref:ribbon-helix-helix domain-containing protein n=1 Tax=Phyllobacterium sp. YR531 TaxID=1144343 RepID=UPI00026F756A|nr:ribbon-helix-helix domain-containing protein [Phyllobacterium sp. YR531]EJN04591.1 putative transcriptional regulators containing the CopG/Arc/MetJ DNA-binding domain [Phyllobacterium sp. YR531]